MDEQTTLLLGNLDQELSGLISGADWAGGEAVLNRARALLEQIDRSGQDALPEKPGAAAQAVPPAGWQAVRTLGDSWREVLCWRKSDDAQLRGRWEMGKLTGVWVQAKGEFWSSQAGKRGDVWVSSRDEDAGPGGKAFSGVLEENMRRGRREGLQSSKTDYWACERCGWENQPGAERCRCCLAARLAARQNEFLPAGAGPTGGLAQAQPGTVGELSASGEMELPAAWAPLGEMQQLHRRAVRALQEAAAQRRPEPARQERKCVRCAQPLQQEHRFCPVCGSPQT